MGFVSDNKGNNKRSKPKINRDERVIIERYLKDGIIFCRFNRKSPQNNYNSEGFLIYNKLE